QSEVLEADKPVLVEFWADWCGPCRQVAPILEEIAAEHGEKLDVRKLDVDANPQTAAAYNVVSIPTMNVYSGGEVVKTIIGAKPKKAILADLAEFLGGVCFLSRWVGSRTLSAREATGSAPATAGRRRSVH